MGNDYRLYRIPRPPSAAVGVAVGLGAAAAMAGLGVGPFGGPGEADAVIVGGDTPTVEISEPVARLSYLDASDHEVTRCTGTVVGARHVLTAAHCVEGDLLGDPSLRLVIDLDDARHEVERVHVHPDYTPDVVAADPDTRGNHHDLAVVEADGPLLTEPVRLAEPDDAAAWPVGSPLVVAGHGRVSTDGERSDVLLAARVERAGVEECGVWGVYVDSDLHLCTTTDDGAACSGDSGGPVFLDRDDLEAPVLVGVVSFGDTECGNGVPDVHVRVDHHRDWIAGVVGDPDPSGVTLRSSDGYWLTTAVGEVVEFGSAPFLGDLAGRPLDAPVVDIAPTPSGDGYALVAADGTVASFGDAPPSAGSVTLTDGDRVASMSLTPSGDGYWLFTEKGRVIAAGDAVHRGDMSGIPLNGPVQDALATPSGRGYWMVASDGGIFAFGDAAFHGSMGGSTVPAPVVSMAAYDGGGYWMVGTDGSVYEFGPAADWGDLPAVLGDTPLNSPVRGIAPYGDGYALFAGDGGVFNFSDLDFQGSLGGNPPASPVVSVATRPGG